MLKRSQLPELPPRLDASPGLLCRRYSVPETIMRKYHLAQQRSESECSGPTTSPSGTSGSPPRGSNGSLCDAPHRSARRDRELMRKSALMRRMWGRSCHPTAGACQPCCCCSSDICEPQPFCARETRSLEGSRSELRPLSSSLNSSRYSHVPATTGWTSPKRQRLESGHDYRGSDDMIRTAMRNSYDRTEESRHEKHSKLDFSDSSYNDSHNEETSTFKETSESTPIYREREKIDVFEKYSDLSSDISTMPLKSEIPEDTPIESRSSIFLVHSDDQSFTDTSDTYTTSMPTTKENTDFKESKLAKQIIKNNCIDGRISEKSSHNSQNAENIAPPNVIVPYDSPISIEPKSYEVLEIIVSETVNTTTTNSLVPVINIGTGKKLPTSTNINSVNNRKSQSFDLDEYVSNILVEGLNSLTDQLESMNASIGNDRKISIVEKEIKVKLQNTGVNTIVHLSPTSNNQIIFGNEELCNNDELKDSCNNALDIQDNITFREDVNSIELNNNYTSVGKSPQLYDAYQDDSSNMIQQSEVNKAVLQQIQKLFQEEYHSLNHEINYPRNTIPEISHIEISNVDVYIDENSESYAEAKNQVIEMHTQSTDIISNVGAGNYFQDVENNIVVPRFTALPHTDSMEVNTSSSDDVDAMGSECTSLVDSLDDPNSPRSILLRRSFNNHKRPELVRSTVDVLDLLPENSYHKTEAYPRERGESFFIRIKDNNCDCEKENIIVADHMPEKIKQRLYRRHRKRELRMECARRSKVKQLKRELEKQRQRDLYKSKKEIEKDCMMIINNLLNDVIAKIAQEEFKYMQIKQKSCKKLFSYEENKSSFNKREKNTLSKRDFVKHNKSVERISCSNNIDKEKKPCNQQIRGKLSLQAHPPMTLEDFGPKRIYQKSEIHDGDKCIEILEILEYADTSNISPETTNSDENHNLNSKSKKSRIPVPIFEKVQKLSQKNDKNNVYRSPSPVLYHNKDVQLKRLLATSSPEALYFESDRLCFKNDTELQVRRASVPNIEPRSRSNSLRFKRVFDIIPEEKSSLSVESSNEDINYNRRVSAPDISDNFYLCKNRENSREIKKTVTSPKRKSVEDITRKYKADTKTVSTSPMVEQNLDQDQKCINKTTMTSPSRRSTATSPMLKSPTELKRVKEENLGCTRSNDANAKRGLSSRPRAWLGFYRADKSRDEEGIAALACAPCH